MIGMSKIIFVWQVPNDHFEVVWASIVSRGRRCALSESTSTFDTESPQRLVIFLWADIADTIAVRE